MCSTALCRGAGFTAPTADLVYDLIFCGFIPVSFMTDLWNCRLYAWNYCFDIITTLTKSNELTKIYRIDDYAAFLTIYILNNFYYKQNLRLIKKHCRPNEVFELDCNMCRCNPDGKSYACTRRACEDQLEDNKKVSLSITWSKSLRLRLKYSYVRYCSEAMFSSLKKGKGNTCWTSTRAK